MNFEFKLPSINHGHSKESDGGVNNTPIESLHLAKEGMNTEYINYVKELYQAISKRRNKHIKINVGASMKGQNANIRTDYTPEIGFQNKLTHWVYEHTGNPSFSFKRLKENSKMKLHELIASDIHSTNREDYSDFHNETILDLEMSIAAVESVVNVALSRRNVAERSKDYIIGTNKELDRVNAIDLVELSRPKTPDAPIEIRLIQVKREGIIKTKEETLRSHQRYLKALGPAIKSLVHRKYDEDFKNTVADRKFTQEDLNKKQYQWNSVALALEDIEYREMSTRELANYIKDNLPDEENTVSVDTILEIHEIVSSPQFKEYLDILIDEKVSPKESREKFISYMTNIKEDFNDILEKYIEINGGVDFKNVKFISVLAGKSGFIEEKQLDFKIN